MSLCLKVLGQKIRKTDYCIYVFLSKNITEIQIDKLLNKVSVPVQFILNVFQ